MTPSTNWEYQAIPIDFDVWKALSSRLESPQETHNDVLRRLLNIKSQVPPTAGPAWLADGVSFPNGSEFRARYKGKDHAAVVRNGALEVNGKRFDSPSAAAFEITRTSVNGWKFWSCRYPGSAAWIAVDGLRQRK